MEQVTFNLVSGIPVTATVFTAKEQRIVSKDDNRPFGTKIMEVVAGVSQTIGDISFVGMPLAERLEHINKLPSGDIQKLLIEVRQASMVDEDRKVFVYPYEYTPVGATKTVNLDIECDLSEGFPEHKYKTIPKDALVGIKSLRELKARIAEKSIEVQAKTIDEIAKASVIEFIEPFSGKTYRFQYLNPAGEDSVKHIKQKNINTMLEARRLQVVLDNGTPILQKESDLDKLPLPIIETIRTVITSLEGRVDSEYQFEHPEADQLPSHKRMVEVSLLSHINFFFPAGLT